MFLNYYIYLKVLGIRAMIYLPNIGGTIFQIFFGFSVAGTFYHGYFFAFHLLNIAANNQLLKGVIKAVTMNGRHIWSHMPVSHPSIHLSNYPYNHSSIRAFIHPSNHPFIQPTFIHPIIHLCIHIIHPYMYPSIWNKMLMELCQYIPIFNK